MFEIHQFIGGGIKRVTEDCFITKKECANWDKLLIQYIKKQEQITHHELQQNNQIQRHLTMCLIIQQYTVSSFNCPTPVEPSNMVTKQFNTVCV